MSENEKRRVVVTGLGMVTPLGIGLEKNWQAIVAGRSGIRPISRIANIEFFASRIAGEVPDFRAEDFIEPKEIKKMDLFIQYSIAAAQMAFQDAGHFGFERVTAGKVLVRQHLGGDASNARALQPWRVGTAAQHARGLRRDAPGAHAVQDRLQVAALSGDQDRDARLGQR